MRVTGPVSCLARGGLVYPHFSQRDTGTHRDSSHDVPGDSQWIQLMPPEHLCRAQGPPKLGAHLTHELKRIEHISLTLHADQCAARQPTQLLRQLQREGRCDEYEGAGVVHDRRPRVRCESEGSPRTHRGVSLDERCRAIVEPVVCAPSKPSTSSERRIVSALPARRVSAINVHVGGRGTVTPPENRERPANDEQPYRLGLTGLEQDLRRRIECWGEEGQSAGGQPARRH